MKLKTSFFANSTVFVKYRKSTGNTKVIPVGFFATEQTHFCHPRIKCELQIVLPNSTSAEILKSLSEKSGGSPGTDEEGGRRTGPTARSEADAGQDGSTEAARSGGAPRRGQARAVLG